MQPFSSKTASKSSSKQSEKSKQTNLPPPVPVFILIAALGLGLLSALPHLGHLAAPKQTVSPSITTVTMENNSEEKNGRLNVFWSNPVSQIQFWLDNAPTPAKCDQHNCTVSKRQGISQIYFRWLDNSDNKWYYFQCSGDYRGQFKGIPL